MFGMATRKTRRALVASAAAATIVLGTGLSSTGTAWADTSLTPDPVAYCETNLPFGQQAMVNGWKIAYKQLSGDSYKNNWQCQYWIFATVPFVTSPGKASNFILPPFTHGVPIDWNAMCNQQFPGAWAVWIPGPETGAAGAPWDCQGPAGVTYDPAENAKGVHAVLSG
jgi:hypothetical protein